MTAAVEARGLVVDRGRTRVLDGLDRDVVPRPRLPDVLGSISDLLPLS